MKPDRSEHHDRILISEADAVIAAGLAAELAAQEYTVCSVAMTGEEAVSAAEREQPDLVLMDIVQDGKMDGFQAADLIRSRWEIPVVFIVVRPDENHRKRVQLIDPLSYLLKPDQTRNIGATIKMVLDIARADSPRKRADDALTETNEEFQAMIDALPDLLFEVDREGHLYRCHASYPELLYLSPDKFLGRSITEVLPGDACKIIFGALSEAAETGKHNGAVYCLNLPLGIKWFELSIAAKGNHKNANSRFLVLARDITQRKNAEKALEESENSHREFVDTLPQIVYEINKDGRFIFLNMKGLEALGYNADDLSLGITTADLLVPESHEQAVKDRKKLLDGDTQVITEHLVKKKDGTAISVITYSSAIFKSGEFIGIRGVAVDITDRLRAEAALRESEALYTKLLETIPDPVVRTDLEGRILFINEIVCKMAGYDVAELIGQNFLRFIAPEDHERIINNFILMFDHKLPPQEYHMIFKDGRKRLFEVHGDVLRDKDGHPFGTVHICRDMNERKEVQEALRRSEEQYRFITDNMQESVWMSDLNFKTTWLSPSTTRTRGYNLEEFQNLTLEDQLTPESLAKVMEIVANILTSERLADIHLQITETMELELICKDGSTIWNELNVTLLRDEEGKPSGLLGVARDITQKKKAEEERQKLEAQLRQSQKMEAIGTLAGGIAHDFNNILAAIMGFTEMTLINTPKGTTARRNLEQVMKAGHRAKNLIQQILSFCRRTAQPRKTIEIDSIICEALKFLRATLPTTIEIRQDLKKNLGAVSADPTQIHQVLTNLCTNAAYAMRAGGGVLTVSLSNIVLEENASSRLNNLPPGLYQRILVSDTGHGLDRNIMERIFEPFFTTKEPGEGTGMGLSVVYGIVKDHGGEITVESEPGKGSTFHVYLPVVKDSVKSDPPEAARPLPTGNEHILFVDDEEALVSLSSEILEHLGYQVTSRTSSLEALEMFRHDPEKFDLIITDQTMPHLTGIELSQEILKIRPDKPIILCTGFSQQVSAEMVLDMGIKRLLLKPFVLRDVANAVRLLLDGSK
ncbi:MAG: PAS domain S-box protein [Deltaproteobacteria bacterium]|nr:PAS domain S-box protein [Deltaproteobacteria bacterium]